MGRAFPPLLTSVPRGHGGLQAPDSIWFPHVSGRWGTFRTAEPATGRDLTVHTQLETKSFVRHGDDGIWSRTLLRRPGDDTQEVTAADHPDEPPPAPGSLDDRHAPDMVSTHLPHDRVEIVFGFDRDVACIHDVADP